MKNKLLKWLLIVTLSATTITGIDTFSSSETVQAARKSKETIIHYQIHHTKKHLVTIIQDANISKNLKFNLLIKGHKGEIYNSSRTAVVKVRGQETLHLTYLNGVGYISSTFIQNYVPDTHPTLETDFEEDCITTPQEVTNTPWEKYSNGTDLIEPLANNRNIYYRIDSTGYMYNLWQKAINAWNSLGIIQFIPTNSHDSQHVLTLSNGDNNVTNGNSPWEGITIPNSNRSSNDALAYNTCYLNNYYMNRTTESDYQKQCVAEHELGHVLGFDHDSRLYGDDDLKHKIQALMNPTSEDANKKFDYLALDAGAKEQHVLMQKYNLNVLPGYFEYPELNLDTVTNGNNVQLAANVPNRNSDYDYQTNQILTSIN